MEKILTSGLSQARTAWLRGVGGGIGELSGRAVSFPTASLKKLSKKECSAPIRYLFACYVISHMLMHAQLPMGCYFDVF